MVRKFRVLLVSNDVAQGWYKWPCRGGAMTAGVARRGATIASGFERAQRQLVIIRGGATTATSGLGGGAPRHNGMIDCGDR